jgi:hypothetical protein
MAVKPKKEGKPMRIKVTTTLDGALWEALQIQAVKEKTYANEILEKLIAGYLGRTAKRKGVK